MSAENQTAAAALPETTAAVTSTAEPVTEPVTETTTAPRIPDDAELVPMKDYIPGLYVDLRYAGTNNFTKKKIYDSDEAVLCYATVKKLIKPAYLGCIPPLQCTGAALGGMSGPGIRC